VIRNDHAGLKLTRLIEPRLVQQLLRTSFGTENAMKSIPYKISHLKEICGHRCPRTLIGGKAKLGQVFFWQEIYSLSHDELSKFIPAYEFAS
jgi:hypothetical protein